MVMSMIDTTPMQDIVSCIIASSAIQPNNGGEFFFVEVLGQIIQLYCANLHWMKIMTTTTFLQ